MLPSTPEPLYASYGYIRRFFGVLIPEPLILDALRNAGYGVETAIHKEGQVGSNGRWEVRGFRNGGGPALGSISSPPAASFEVHQGYKDNKGPVLVDTIVQGLSQCEASELDAVARILEQAYAEARVSALGRPAAEAELKRAREECRARHAKHCNMDDASPLLFQAQQMCKEGKAVEARDAYMQALEKQQEKLGGPANKNDKKGHLRVASTKCSLAEIEKGLGNLRVAAGLFKDALELQNRFLKPGDDQLLKRIKMTQRNHDKILQQLGSDCAVPEASPSPGSRSGRRNPARGPSEGGKMPSGANWRKRSGRRGKAAHSDVAK